LLLKLVSSQLITLTAKAVGRSQGYPICALGLDVKAKGTVYLEANARVTAQFCAVQSNSKHPQGLTGAGNSVLTAGAIFTSGGKFGKRVNFYPDPVMDCPIVADPLASRPAPAVRACDYTNQVVSGATMTLTTGI
jgi:hypothetical protein